MCLCKTKYQRGGYRTILGECWRPCKGGGIAPFWGSANVPENVSRDMGTQNLKTGKSDKKNCLMWFFSDVFLSDLAFS